MDTFPRQQARTRRFTLGEPRTLTVSPDGQRVVFLRSASGSDPVTDLWVLDVASGEERLVADARALLGGGDDDLPPAERARRERAREQAGGITAYATDADVLVAAFALGGRLFGAGLLTGAAREIPVEGPVFDPRPDPTARRVAYVSGRQLRVAELDGSWRTLAGEDDVDISWGSAEFVAAEEMGRSRGYWWSPGGEHVAVARVDVKAVARWYISDPSNPGAAPAEHAYPRAGTPNAVVSLHVLGLDGSRVDVDWDRDALPYLAEVSWPDAGTILVTVQDRAQREVQVLAADPATGSTRVLVSHRRDDWVELVSGTPAWLDGKVVTAADIGGCRRLCVDGDPVTAVGLQVRAVLSAAAGSVLFQANPMDDPTVLHVHRWSESGVEALTSDPGVHTGLQGGATTVIRSASLSHDGIRTQIAGGAALTSYAESPLVDPRPHLFRGGKRHLAVAVLLPAGTNPDDASVKLPVLLDPYGGPHAQRVQHSRAQFLTSQWFADQGFAVVVADGRGTPGRGTEWERAVHHDLAAPVLEDQVDALLAAAERFPCLDLDRVGIRGWSFGGYLAALAVLRRPDVFHAAVAGAPVTEWRLYDTHYTERYLGDPETDPEPYDRSSLLFDAAKLERALLLVHGLADDNVVAAHTLQLSSALLAAGRPHSVLPLVGVTHMAPQEQVAENLLLLQLDFLRRALRIEPTS